jgi:hypothetical protein
MNPTPKTKTDGCANVEDKGSLLADIATSIDCGRMERVTAINDFCVEWQSTNKGQFAMQIPSMLSLLHNWDGNSDVYWFFDGTLLDGTIGRCVVLVPGEQMAYLESKLKNQGQNN